jgi:predicted ATPase
MMPWHWSRTPSDELRRTEISFNVPEALRVKANALLALPEPRVDDAEACLIGSLDWSRRQGARSWELRAAVDLALLRSSQHKTDRAREVLEPVLMEFAEGFDTADVRAATQLLATLP